MLQVTAVVKKWEEKKSYKPRLRIMIVKKTKKKHNEKKKINPMCTSDLVQK